MAVIPNTQSSGTDIAPAAASVAPSASHPTGMNVFSLRAIRFVAVAFLSERAFCSAFKASCLSVASAKYSLGLIVPSSICFWNFAISSSYAVLIARFSPPPEPMLRMVMNCGNCMMSTKKIVVTVITVPRVRLFSIMRPSQPRS